MTYIHVKLNWNLPGANELTGELWGVFCEDLVKFDCVICVYLYQWILCLYSIYMFNTLRPRQNGPHFPDDIFKCIFLNENVWISIRISLKFVPKGPINNIPA